MDCEAVRKGFMLSLVPFSLGLCTTLHCGALGSEEADQQRPLSLVAPSALVL